jgi:hypothetical protein
MNMIKKPAQKIILIEELGPNDAYCTIASGGDSNDLPHYRHNWGCNFGFADYHSEWKQQREIGYSMNKRTNNLILESRTKLDYYFNLTQ